MRALAAVMVGGLMLPATVGAQAPTQCEQLRAAIVSVLSGPLCLAKNHTNFVEGKWSVIPDGYECARAQRDALAALVLTAELPPDPPPPAGSAAVVTCTYPINVDAPPVCRAGLD